MSSVTTEDRSVFAEPSQMCRRPPMRRNLSWTLLGNSIYTLCQWGMLVAMAKLGTPEMVGVFGLALAVTAPVVMFFNLELRSVQATDARQEYRFGDYLGVRLITSVLALTIIVFIACVIGRSLETFLVIAALGLAKGIESVSDVVYGLFQNRERMDRIAASMIVKGVLGLTALGVAVYLTGRLLPGVVALAGAWIIVLMSLDIPWARRLLSSEPGGGPEQRLTPIWNGAVFGRLVRLSLPLGCVMVLVSLNVNIPRYFVQGYLGERSLGFFVAISYLMVAVNTVVNALGQAASPRLAQYFADGRNRRAFRLLMVKLVAAIAAVSGIGVLVVVAAGREILTVIYRPEYAEQADLFVWLMIAAGIGGVGVILRYGAISARRFAPQLPLWILIVAANAAACLLLIPKHGLIGAGVAITISACAQVLGNLVILIRADAAYNSEASSRQFSRPDADAACSRLGIVAPGCTDVNKGDQALVWETIEAIKDAGVVDNIALLGNSEGADDSEKQTRGLGHDVLPSLLSHPRRGRIRPEDKIREQPVSLLLMIAYSVIDFVRGQMLLLAAPYPAIARLLTNAEQRRTYLALLRARALFVKGGGFIHSYGGLTAPYHTWYSLFYVKLAHRLGIPVILLPNSFGPFIGFSVKRQIRIALARCAFVCARESTSAKALGQLLGAQVPVFPDLGYFLAPADKDVGMRICREAGVPLGDKRCVGFTVRPYRFPGSEDSTQLYSRYLDALAFLVKHVRSLGFHPVMVTQVAGPSAHENDTLAIRDLLDRLRGEELSWVDHRGSCRELKAVYGCMDYVVGTRFHSVVFAQGLEVPSMAIAYGGNKATGIMSDMGLSSYVVPIEDVSGARLCSVFDELVANDEEVRSKLRDWLARAAKRREEMVEALREALA